MLVLNVLIVNCWFGGLDPASWSCEELFCHFCRCMSPLPCLEMSQKEIQNVAKELLYFCIDCFLFQASNCLVQDKKDTRHDDRWSVKKDTEPTPSLHISA